MTESKLSTPVAIMVAGGLIGLGLFFGLRDRGREAAPLPPAAAVPSSATTAADRPAPRAAEAPAPLPPINELRDRVGRDVAAALEAQRPALVDKCWKPHAAATPPPKPARFTFNFTIGADGVQLARGVAEQRGAGSPEITSCVLQSLGMVRVTPPGTSVVVDVPFGLP